MFKKTIFIFSLLTVSLFVSAQVSTLTTNPVDSVSLTDAAQALDIDSTLNAFTVWFDGCGNDLVFLIRSGKTSVSELVTKLTGAPAPNTAEGVEYWTDLIDWFWAVGKSLITTIVVFFLSLFKSKEAAMSAGNKLQEWFDGIKTRWLVAFTAPVVTVIGLAFFKEGGWTIIEAIGWTIGTGAGAMFIAQLLEWLPFNFNLTARKSPTA